MQKQIVNHVSLSLLGVKRLGLITPGISGGAGGATVDRRSAGGVVATAVARLASTEAVRGLPMGRVLCCVQHVRAIPAGGQNGEGDVAGRQSER